MFDCIDVFDRTEKTSGKDGDVTVFTYLIQAVCDSSFFPLL